MEKRDRKRRSLSTGSSSSQVRPRKAYLFCQGESEEYGWEYIIFVADLEPGVDKAVVSRIRIDMECFSHASFCVIGLTLFAFEGFTCRFAEMNPDPRLIVFKYELPLLERFDCRLDRSMFVKAGELNDSKIDPFATVLGDGRILVFSTTIEIGRYWERRCDFEIFDPVKGVSHELARLYPNDSLVGRRDSFHIISHAIMESSVVIKTDFGIFIYNLKPSYKTKSWRFCTFAGAPNVPTHPSSSFVVIGKKICVVSYYAFDMDGLKGDENAFGRWYYRFPDLSLIPDKGFVFGGSTILEDNFSMEDNIGLCFVKLGVDSDTRHPRMAFDVYQLDLQECGKDLAAIRKKKREDGTGRELILLPGVAKVASFEYSDEAAKFGTFRMRHFSYIRTE